MAKFPIPLIIMICALIAIGLLLDFQPENPELESWIGEYTYTQVFPTTPEDASYPVVPCIDYDIRVFKDRGGVRAEINNQGFQTSTHMLAKITGNSQQIDLILEGYYDDNVMEFYQKGDALMSLSLADGQIYTTWRQMKSDSVYVTGQTYGIYFTKVD